MVLRDLLQAGFPHTFSLWNTTSAKCSKAKHKTTRCSDCRWKQVENSGEIQSWTYVLVSCYSSSDHCRQENRLRSVKKFNQEQNRGLAQESMCARGKETQRISSPGSRRRPGRGWREEFSFEAKSPFLVPVFFKLQVVTPWWIVRSVL